MTLRVTGLLLCLLLIPGCRDEAPGDEPPDAMVPVCGDSVAMGDELCDGEDLRGQTCASLGLGAAEGLACAPDCRFDTTACLATGCGDGFCDPDDGESQLDCPQDCAWTDVAARERHSCGIRVDGSVWCWGKNHGGQLGSEPGVTSSVPLRVVGVPPAAQLAVGAAHGCARTLDGAVWCWGSNLRGQLGVGYGDTGPLPPTPIDGLGAVVSLAAGASHSCAVTDTGGVRCWGDNRFGQLGNDAPANVWIPSTVVDISDAATIAIGGDDECPFTCATTTGHQGLCWGCNTHGALGRGAPVTDWDSHPEPVLAGSSTCESLVVALGGGGHACARTQQDGLCCWGLNDAGQLGLGLTVELQPTALAVEHPVGVAAVWGAAGLGGRHGCAVLATGALLCWGANHFGQLGDDDETEHYLPRVVPGFDDAVAVSGGVEHTCVVRADSTLWCFGQNFFGQLGDGNTIDRAMPGPVAF